MLSGWVAASRLSLQNRVIRIPTGAVSLAVDCSVALSYGQTLWAGWFKPEAARVERKRRLMVGRL